MKPFFSVVPLLMGACAGDPVDGTSTATDLTACEGLGDPVLSMGSGGRDGFASLVNGDLLQISDGGGGNYGFFLELLSDGLDTREPMSALVRFSLGSETATEDLIALLNLQCPDEGPGWTSVFAAFGDDYPDEASAMALDGVAIHVSANLTDAAEETGTVALDLTLVWP